MFELMQGDCLEVLEDLPENSVDAVVTDPPYELNFMAKRWDSTGIASNPNLWAQVLRVLKPGGHLASFSSTRTYHRMACAIEDAGFEVRNMHAWVFGQGFPKSLNVGVAIAKSINPEWETGDDMPEAALQWEGWGTATKPALEPICLARKPLSEKTVAANVLRWGTGAINIGACKIESGESTIRPNGPIGYHGGGSGGTGGSTQGRFPANLCHDGSDEVLDLFPESKSGIAVTRNGGGRLIGGNGIYGGSQPHDGVPDSGYSDAGSAARFFYCAKASKGDRSGSKHPTVKPIKLMQWLCRLITPPGGVVLDPFAGSGTTGAAAILEGFRPILIEREDEYVADIRRRLGLHGASDAVITHDTLGEVA
jgi:site-specific DNA-methyltransferase (adenine-specific)